MTRSPDRHLSIRDFIFFSLFVYPVALLAFIYRKQLATAVHSEVLFFVLLFLVFATLNWIWGQKKLSLLLLVCSYLAGNTLFYLWARGGAAERTLYGDTIPLLMALIFYPFTFLIFTFAQFFVWIPFLIRYLWWHRHNLNNLSWT